MNDIDPFRGMKWCKKHLYWYRIEKGCSDCKKIEELINKKDKEVLDGK